MLDAHWLLQAFLPVMRDGPPASGGWGAAVDQSLAAYAPPALQRARDLYQRSLEVSKPVCAPAAAAGAAGPRSTEL